MRLALAAVTIAAAMLQASAGTASWYGPAFHGRLTASGETFDQDGATCAHRTLPFDTLVRVTNLDNGRQATCRISDRGPFVRGRVLDVSRSVAQRLGMIRAGTAPVTLSIIK